MARDRLGLSGWTVRGGLREKGEDPFPPQEDEVNLKSEQTDSDDAYSSWYLAARGHDAIFLFRHFLVFPLC